MQTLSQRIAGPLQGLSTLQLQRLLSVFLGLWLLYSLSQTLWLWFGPEPANATAANTSALTLGKSEQLTADDISRLQSLHLFGRIGEQSTAAQAVLALPEEAAINAAKTKLNLSLEGVVYSSQPAGALAVIVYQGKQDQYRIEDKLPVGRNVSLRQVFVDHVILDNAGRLESLWLYDDEKIKAATTAKKRAPVVSTKINMTDKRSDKKVTELAKDYRKRLYKNPKSLADVLRTSPAKRDGEFIGYRVSPGKDRRQFAALGFKTNDIVTSINDVALDDPAKALEVYKLMRTAKEATFTVDRGGESIEIMVSLGE